MGTVSTDTRTIGPGCLFIALRGESFDGHKFLNHAAAAGAVAAVVDSIPPAVPDGLALIQVVDTKTAMGKLATFVRSRLRGR